MALKSRSLDRVCKEHNPCPFFMVEEPPPFEYYYKKEPAWLPLRRCTPNGRIRRQTQTIIVRSSDVDLDLVIPAGEDPEDRRQMMEAFLHQLNDVRIHVLSPPPHTVSLRMQGRQDIWEDVRVSYHNALRKKLTVRVATDDKLLFKHPFIYDIFDWAVKECQLQKQIDKRRGWAVLGFSGLRAGLQFCVLLLGGALPTKTRYGVKVCVAKVEQVAYSRENRLLRLRLVFKTQPME